MFTPVRLINPSFASHSNHFVVVIVMVKTLKLYSHSNFQVYITVLLITVIMLDLRSPKLTYLITESLQPLTWCFEFYNNSDI